MRNKVGEVMNNIDKELYFAAENVLKSTVNKMKKELDALTQGEITLAEVDTLMVIGDGEPKSMKEIVKGLDVANSTPTRTVDRLVKKKVVVRFIDEEDRRKTLVVLTEEGRNIYRHLCKQRDEQIAAAFLDLTREEKEALLKVFDKMNRNLIKD